MADMKRYRVVRILLLVVSVLSCSWVSSQVNVLTWHNDNWRTGQNTQETTLTTATVGDKTRFGRICSYTLQTNEQVYAQPLVVSSVTFKGQSSPTTVIYVATQEDNVYAFDGNSTGPAWGLAQLCCLPTLR